MKIAVKNLGVLRQAEFSLGDFTIICGSNNTGKTYATYALFGFLWRWRHFLEVDIPAQTIGDLLKGGVTRVDITHFCRKSGGYLETGLSRLLTATPEVFCFSRGAFQKHDFSSVYRSGKNFGSSRALL